MSTQRDIHGFLASVAKGSSGEYVAMTPEAVATQMGVPRNKINKTLFNLMTTGKVELMRGPNGRSIIGFKLIEGPRERGARMPREVTRRRLEAPIKLQPREVTRRRSSLHTPALDQYAEAKAKFERAKEDFGDLIEASFKEHPYAEEGMMLRARLDSIEGQWADMTRQLEEANRELRYLRGKHQDELAREAVRSGAVVLTGD